MCLSLCIVPPGLWQPGPIDVKLTNILGPECIIVVTQLPYPLGREGFGILATLKALIALTSLLLKNRGEISKMMTPLNLGRLSRSLRGLTMGNFPWENLSSLYLVLAGR